MIWYYAHEGKRIGPVDDAEFAALVETGVILPETLVWNETLSQWVQYATLTQSAGPQSQDTARQREVVRQCYECGRMFPEDEMIRYQNTWICARCKPLFVQKIKEGAHLSTDFTYAGFWIRFLAKFLDGMIQGTISFVGLMIIVFVVGGSMLGNEDGYWIMGAAINIFQLFSFAFGVFYTTFFLGKFGATPGKMICGLQVIVADGSEISYIRSLGRHFAELLNSLTLFIGYIMAAFDDEKRALHDRICETRVIKK